MAVNALRPSSHISSSISSRPSPYTNSLIPFHLFVLARLRKLDETADGTVKQSVSGRHRDAKQTQWAVGVVARASEAIKMEVVGLRRFVPDCDGLRQLVTACNGSRRPPFYCFRGSVHNAVVPFRALSRFPSPTPRCTDASVQRVPLPPITSRPSSSSPSTPPPTDVSNHRPSRRQASRSTSTTSSIRFAFTQSRARSICTAAGNVREPAASPPAPHSPQLVLLFLHAGRRPVRNCQRHQCSRRCSCILHTTHNCKTLLYGDASLNI
jgi:hypothetical protein